MSPYGYHSGILLSIRINGERLDSRLEKNCKMLFLTCRNQFGSEGILVIFGTLSTKKNTKKMP